MSNPNTLLKAVTAGRSRQVRLLLDLGASLEEQDECGQTPLIRAVLIEHDRNRDKIVRTLLKRGAIVSKADVVGRNALMWACLYGRDNDVKLLIEHADVDMDFNLADINGQTALFHAVSSGNAATVKLVVAVLMKYGLSTDTTDNRGVTPLMHAIRLKHDICESILIYEGNAKVGLSDYDKYNKKDKWAITSLRDRSKVKITRNRIKQSQFPPIGGGHKSHLQIKHSDTDDSLSSDEDNLTNDLIVGNNAESLDNNKYTPLIGGMNSHMIKSYQNVPQCAIPPSVFASLTGSGVGNTASSDDESEADSVASTIIEGNSGRKTMVQSADIVTIYGMKQEQMSTSYRQTAVNVDNPSIVEERTPTPMPKGFTDSETRKWTLLKKNFRQTSMFKKNQSENSPREDKQSPRLDSNLTRGLPSIFSERKSQLFSKLKTNLLNTANKNPRVVANECKTYSEN